MKGKHWAAILVLAASLSSTAVSGRSEEILQAAVSPETISIGSFYDGSTVRATGRVPADCEAVVRIMGEMSELHLKKKGKMLGLLWMNLETLTFEGVPNAYLLYASNQFEEMLGQPCRGETRSGWNLGLQALCDRVAIVPEQSDKREVFGEFLKLKEAEGLYGLKDSIRYAEPKDGFRTFEAGLDIPPSLPPGEYTITVYAVRNGEILARLSRPLSVKLESLPALTSLLAFRYSALYGALATAIALAAGILTSFLFGAGKGAH